MTSNTFYFDPEAAGLRVFLGPTEADLMAVAWEKGQVTVKSALFALGSESTRAYTTVMTVLNRLHSKGLLKRSKTGRHYVYTPSETRESFLAERVAAVESALKRAVES